MPQITDLKLQKNKRVVNVFVDNQYTASLNLDTVVKKGIKIGSHFTQKELEEIIDKAVYEKLTNYALNYLSFRPRSEREVKSYLIKKIKQGRVSCSKEKIICKVIENLKNKKITNDYEFVNWWIEQRTKYQPKGNYLLKKELYVKGIDKKIIEAAISKRDELEAGRILYRKKMLKFNKIDDDKTKQRIIGMLQRRGFSWETIKQVVDVTLMKK